MSKLIAMRTVDWRHARPQRAPVACPPHGVHRARHHRHGGTRSRGAKERARVHGLLASTVPSRVTATGITSMGTSFAIFQWSPSYASPVSPTGISSSALMGIASMMTRSETSTPQPFKSVGGRLSSSLAPTTTSSSRYIGERMRVCRGLSTVRDQIRTAIGGEGGSAADADVFTGIAVREGWANGDALIALDLNGEDGHAHVRVRVPSRRRQARHRVDACR